MDIRREIAALIGHSVTDIAPLGGGCVSAVYEVRLDDGRRLVVKHDEVGGGGLAVEAAGTGPRFEIDPEAAAPANWTEAEGDGTLRRLALDVGQVNAAFAAHSDPRARRKCRAAGLIRFITRSSVM